MLHWWVAHPEGTDLAHVSEDRLGDTAEGWKTKVSFSFTLHLQISHSSVPAFTGNAGWWTPAFIWNIAEFMAEGKERMESYTLWLLKLCLEMTHLFCSHFICQWISISWLCMSSTRWRCIIFHREGRLCGRKASQSTACASPLFCHSYISFLFLRRGLQSLIWNHFRIHNFSYFTQPLSGKSLNRIWGIPRVNISVAKHINTHIKCDK